MNVPRIHSRVYALVFLCAPVFLVAVLATTGCDSGDNGKIEYSQKFDLPPGVTINPNPDSKPPLTLKQRRMKDTEEAEQEAARAAKGKRRRP